MTDQNKSSDLLGVFKDIWQTGTQELSKNVGSMLASTPPKPDATSGAKMPSGGSNQVSVALEKREKEIIERRKG